MKCAVAIFAKTIGMTPVKTRLAADIGVTEAEAFYRLSVACVEDVVHEAAGRNAYLFPHWALAEGRAVALKDRYGFGRKWTGEGGLGARLANVSEMLFAEHDAVIFIGTDSPQLSPDVFEAAYAAISASMEDCVAGPAKDGGFYLFGSARPVSREIWESIEYSRETTLADLQARIELEGRRVTSLGVEQDADVLEDLATLKDHLEAVRADLLPAQAALLEWLERR